ncbi:unnamed protein product, partial [Ectocarpus sp. 13 AM-2016]
HRRHVHQSLWCGRKARHGASTSFRRFRMTGATNRSKNNDSKNMTNNQHAGNAQQPKASRTRSAQAQKELQAQ